LRNRVVQEPPPPEVAVLDPDAAPLYWQEPGMLLNLFGEMAERNLFLVQHLQVRLAPMPRARSASPWSDRYRMTVMAPTQHNCALAACPKQVRDIKVDDL